MDAVRHRAIELVTTDGLRKSRRSLLAVGACVGFDADLFLLPEPPIAVVVLLVAAAFYFSRHI